MLALKDQLERDVEIEQSAQRIVSLVPSQTELLHYLGLGEKVVGITKFCIHPSEWFQSKNRVGGTKNVAIEKVKELQPDLIIANKEENTLEDIQALEQIATVYISDVNTIDEALQMIKDVGVLCGKEQEAVDLIDDIQEDFNSFPTYSGTVAYFIWRDPYMVCGTNNFINTIINKLGFTNVIESPRYVELTADQIKALNPDYIFLSTEPFPFTDEHKAELSELTSAKIKIVDGEMFSWYGSRMLNMRSYFEKF